MTRKQKIGYALAALVWVAGEVASWKPGDSSAGLLAMLASRRTPAPTAPAPPTPTDPGQHYGTATLPQAFATHTPSNNNGTGTVHSPMTDAALSALLASGTLQANDTIVLQRGTCYNSGPFATQKFPKVGGPILPSKLNPIRVISSSLGSIAAPGARRNRLTERAAVPHFRKFNSGPAVVVATGASGYEFVGIEADAGSVTSDTYDVVRIGPVAIGPWESTTTYAAGDMIYNGWVSVQNGNLNHPTSDPAWWRQMTFSDIASDIVLDRCDFWVRNYSNRGARTLMMEARNVVITGCTIGNEGGAGLESKAIGTVNSAGPWFVDNSEILAPTIPFLVGGAKPNIDTMVRDCVFSRNLCGLLSRWVPGQNDYDGLSRRRKNLFELKVGERFDIRDNRFTTGDDGVESQYQSIVFKSSNGSDAPGQPGYLEAVTGDITFRYNVLHNVNGLFNIGAQDNYNNGPLPAPVHDISIYHNYTDGLFGGLNTGPGKNAKGIVIKSTAVRVHIEHLTAFGDHTKADTQLLSISDGGLPVGLVFRNIIGSWGNGYGAIWAAGFTRTGSNVFTGSGSSQSAVYIFDPANMRPGSVGPSTYNAFTVSTSAAGMVTDYAGGNWTTAAALNNAGYGGRTPGCDIALVNSRTAGCVSGVWSA